MTETLQVLGQLNPPASTLTPLYTCGSALGAAASSISVCNQDIVPVLFNVSVAVGGAADTPAQYLYYQLSLDTNDTFIATVGITLALNDVVRVWASSANVSFQLFGVQVS